MYELPIYGALILKAIFCSLCMHFQVVKNSNFYNTNTIPAVIGDLKFPINWQLRLKVLKGFLIPPFALYFNMYNSPASKVCYAQIFCACQIIFLGKYIFPLKTSCDSVIIGVIFCTDLCTSVVSFSTSLHTRGFLESFYLDWGITPKNISVNCTLLHKPHRNQHKSRRNQ